MSTDKGKIEVHPDGTAGAVGINFAHVDADSSYFGGGPRRFAVAELIQPWLEKWNLTVVTTPPQVIGVEPAIPR